MKSFLVIGMDSFGQHLVKKLYDRKCEVMIADMKPEPIEEVMQFAVSAKVGDLMKAEVLRSFGIANFDACFVSVDDFTASLQITSLLKELGAKKVFCKASDDVQEKFLLLIGADHVIYPERDIAERIAISESTDSIFDCLMLSDDCAMLEIKPLPKWCGKTVSELNIRVKYNISVLAEKKGSRVTPVTSGNYTFAEDRHIIVIGRIEDISKILK